MAGFSFGRQIEFLTLQKPWDFGISFESNLEFLQKSIPNYEETLTTWKDHIFCFPFKGISLK